MILSVEDLYSDDQDLSGNGAGASSVDSTNIIKLPDNAALGNPLRILIQVTKTFTAGTSLQIDLETDDNSGFSSLSTVWSSAVIAAADLKAGYKFEIQVMPRSLEEFSRLEYNLVDNFTAANLTAGIVFDEQSAKNTYPS